MSFHDAAIAVLMAIATVVMGVLKRREVQVERWEWLIKVAETAWQAVEAWKAKERKVRGSIPPPMGGTALAVPTEVKPTETEAKFVEHVKGVVAKLSKGEEEKLREWVRMRSLAGKHSNGLVLKYKAEE